MNRNTKKEIGDMVVLVLLEEIRRFARHGEARPLLDLVDFRGFR